MICTAGAVPGGRQAARQAEERSISSVPEGFFDEPATSGGPQVWTPLHVPGKLYKLATAELETSMSVTQCARS